MILHLGYSQMIHLLQIYEFPSETVIYMFIKIDTVVVLYNILDICSLSNLAGTQGSFSL